MIGWIIAGILYIEGSIAALGFFATHSKNSQKILSDSRMIGLALLWVLFWPILTPIFLSMVIYTLLVTHRSAVSEPTVEDATTETSGSVSPKN